MQGRSFRPFVFSCFVFLSATAAWGQEKLADKDGWMPVKSTPAKTLHSQKDNAYVNPSTGSMVTIPPPPPRVGSFDEWTPVQSPGSEEGSLVRPTAFQQPPERGPGKPAKAPGEELTQEVQIQLEPPGPEAVFKRESEQAFMERLRQLSRQQKTTRFDFPDEPILSTERYTGRSYPPMNMQVEPNYLCYGRLLFEDLNSERYGWDLGFVQPLVSSAWFLWDMAMLPYHTATAPCRCFECNAGYCLPGDPVPYLLYPPELSLTGATWEAGVIVALFAIFPG
jgi:hypothetical protein